MAKKSSFVMPLVIGLVLGVVVTFIIIYSSAPSMMIHEDKVNMTFDDAVEKFEETVKAHNWKIPAVHDLQKTMDKFGYDVKKVKVFELCHPDHAYEILKESEERIVSSMMPCRVAFYEKADGSVYVSRMNSSLMAGMMGGVIDEVMSRAAAENEEILEVILD